MREPIQVLRKQQTREAMWAPSKQANKSRVAVVVESFLNGTNFACNKGKEEKRREEIEQQKWGFKTTPQHTHTHKCHIL